jgi:hypothetical protein
MSIARDPSVHARIAARGRWGNQVVSRAAETVIARAGELSPDQWEQIRLAHAEQESAARRAAVQRAENRG